MEVHMSHCLEQLRRRAKDLLSAAKSGDPEAIAFTRGKDRLTDVQHALAQSLGANSWPKLVSSILEEETPAFFKDVVADDVAAAVKRLGCLPELATKIDSDGRTALHIAAETGQTDLIAPLIKAGADPSAKFGQSAHTALSWAVTVNEFAFAEEMVKFGAKPDLFVAAGMGHVERVESFWKDGHLQPSPSATGSSRTTESGDRLPRPPQSDGDQASDALYFAARNGRIDVVKWLLAQGADPNFRGYLGGTCLHWGEFGGNDAVSKALRESGGADDLVDYEFGATPRAFGVIVPAAWGIARILVNVLENHPERVNLTCKYGTALNAAAWNGQADSARILLRFGADRTIVNRIGQTPLEVARERSHQEVVEVLSGPENPS